MDAMEQGEVMGRDVLLAGELDTQNVLIVMVEDLKEKNVFIAMEKDIKTDKRKV